MTRRMNRTEAAGAVSGVPPPTRLPLVPSPTPVDLRRSRRSWRPPEGLAAELLAMREGERLVGSIVIPRGTLAAMISPCIGTTQATLPNDSMP